MKMNIGLAEGYFTENFNVQCPLHTSTVIHKSVHVCTGTCVSFYDSTEGRG